MAQRREHLAARTEVGMTAMRIFRGPIESERQFAKGGWGHSAATANPICSQVGATSETVARRMSRL